MRARWPRVSGAVAILATIGGGVCAAIFAKRRDRALQQALHAVIGGDLSARVPHRGRLMPDRRGVTLNATLDRIEAQMTDLRDGARDIGHELRTPLVRLRSHIAVLARRADDVSLADDLAALVTEVDQILELFASLTRLSEIERGARRGGFGVLDLPAIVQDVTEMLATVAEDAGDQLTVAELAPVTVYGDANLLRQTIVNLIENAIRHTPPGIKISVSVMAEQTTARLVVADDGPGIPNEHRQIAMRKFGRLDLSTEGQGLGLALVDAIVRLHEGVVQLEDAAPGLRVVIVLPAAP